MPFKPSNLYISRGAYNQSVGPDNAGLHTYISDDDLFVDITGLDYFPAYFGVSDDRVKINDLVFIKDATNNYLTYKVVELSPLTLTQDIALSNPFDQTLNTTSVPTFAGETLTPQVANPGDSTTLWISSMDGHVYRGTIDLEMVGVTDSGIHADNEIARFDGTGSVIQGSPATISDTGAATFIGRVTISPDVFFDNEAYAANSSALSFDLGDAFVFDKISNKLSFFSGASELFNAQVSSNFKVSSGVDTIDAVSLAIGATNAANVSITPILLANAVEGTSFTDTSLSGGGITPAQINNTGTLERGSAQKTLFFEVDYNSDASNYRTRSVALNASFNFTFSVPSDFNSIVNLVLVGWPNAGADGAGKDIDLTSSYSGVGEDINAHSESDLGSTYNLGTVNTKFELDISGVFSSLSAGDSCGINVKHNSIGGAVDYMHIRLDYI